MMKVKRYLTIVVFFLSYNLMYADNSTRNDTQVINFKDPLVKEICVSHWDKNGDGELSIDEAAAVKNIDDAFWGRDITSFDEFRYFTNVTNIRSFIIDHLTGDIIIDILDELADSTHWSFTRAPRYEKIGAFYDCSKLESITIPKNVKRIGEKAFQNCI